MTRRHLWVALAVALNAATPAPPEAPAEPAATVIHPAGLAQLIQALGGLPVHVVNAELVAVLNPQAFLIESSGPLRPLPGRRDRVLVLVNRRQLSVAAEVVVGHAVRVRGTARSILGMQVSREVPWPRELTRETVERYEIRAAVLASSVQTPDGVELTTAASAD